MLRPVIGKIFEKLKFSGKFRNNQEIKEIRENLF